MKALRYLYPASLFLMSMFMAINSSKELVDKNSLLTSHYFWGAVFSCFAGCLALSNTIREES